MSDKDDTSAKYFDNKAQQENDTVETKKITKRTNSRNVHLRDDAGELYVITKSKDLSMYVFTVTAKAPKHFRYTLIAKMHNLCLELIDNLYSANSVILRQNDTQSKEKRKNFQIRALNILRMLEYCAELAYKQQCILKKQYVNIGINVAECTIFLNNWLASDKKRFN